MHHRPELVPWEPLAFFLRPQPKGFRCEGAARGMDARSRCGPKRPRAGLCVRARCLWGVRARGCHRAPRTGVSLRGADADAVEGGERVPAPFPPSPSSLQPRRPGASSTDPPGRLPPLPPPARPAPGAAPRGRGDGDRRAGGAGRSPRVSGLLASVVPSTSASRQSPHRTIYSPGTTNNRSVRPSVPQPWPRQRASVRGAARPGDRTLGLAGSSSKAPAAEIRSVRGCGVCALPAPPHTTALGVRLGPVLRGHFWGGACPSAARAPLPTRGAQPPRLGLPPGTGGALLQTHGC